MRRGMDSGNVVPSADGKRIDYSMRCLMWARTSSSFALDVVLADDGNYVVQHDLVLWDRVLRVLALVVELEELTSGKDAKIKGKKKSNVPPL